MEMKNDVNPPSSVLYLLIEQTIMAWQYHTNSSSLQLIITSILGSIPSWVLNFRVSLLFQHLFGYVCMRPAEQVVRFWSGLLFF